ncbi:MULTISPECIES: RodZ domain-containing protein [Pseudidiomarina]|uniref:Cytoskeleton protein RodZ n=2 Tax=Pseudidiomarina TaxID=2800384 RepID=A0A368UME1_9GAMM|nr:MULTISPECIES: RodZ domain-containing protein [Pseudidiomarina]PWW10346.1 cytoskeleton protein RodZ [Pseudidiomarina maritima]RBP87949.1 cytoskeleton protein RodZ [Pseudidiomarina tainanensis]RCW29932.1 cytoskeleton protein RodZ [Pseudidiomarina tainanensis]
MTNKQSKSNNSKPQTDDIFADEHKDANADASTAVGQKAAQERGQEAGQEAGQEHSQESRQESSAEAAYSGETAGQILRAAREAKGLSEQQVADSLRLRLIVVKTIEADDFEKLGTATYVRGYLRSISKALDVDSAKVFAAYQAQGFGEAPAAELKMQSFSRRKVRERNDSRLMLISYIIIALVIAMAIAWWWQDSQNNDSDAQVEPRSEVTETNSPEGNARRATTVPLDTGSTFGSNDASSGSAGSSTSGSNSDSNGGNTGDTTSDNSGGSTSDSTGGNTGGTSGGSTSDTTSDNSGSSTGGNTASSTGGNTGGSNSGTSGGNPSDTTSDNSGGNTSGSTNGSNSDNSGGNTSDSTGGTNTDGTNSDSTSGTTGSSTGSTGSGNSGSNTAGQDSLVLEFSQRCWVKVTEAGGNDIAIGVKEPGYRMPLTGNAPFDLILCKPEAVTITYNDAPVDLSNYRRNRSVTMTIE